MAVTPEQVTELASAVATVTSGLLVGSEVMGLSKRFKPNGWVDLVLVVLKALANEVPEKKRRRFW